MVSHLHIDFLHDPSTMHMLNAVYQMYYWNVTWLKIFIPICMYGSILKHDCIHTTVDNLSTRSMYDMESGENWIYNLSAKHFSWIQKYGWYHTLHYSFMSHNIWEEVLQKLDGVKDGLIKRQKR